MTRTVGRLHAERGYINAGKAAASGLTISGGETPNAQTLSKNSRGRISANLPHPNARWAGDRMMNIDLKWGLPFVMPFVLLGTARLLWLVAGAEWYDPVFAALASLISGLAVGRAIAGFMHDEGVHWTVRLGPERTPHD